MPAEMAGSKEVEPAYSGLLLHRKGYVNPPLTPNPGLRLERPVEIVITECCQRCLEPLAREECPREQGRKGIGGWATCAGEQRRERNRANGKKRLRGQFFTH